MNYLLNTKTHPSAEDIYNHILSIYPNISRATVYNNITSLKEADMIQEITIEKDKARYDANLKPHAHFFCNVCKSVIDINLDSSINLSNINLGDLIVESCHIYFYGVCDNCSIEKRLQLIGIETYE